MKSLENERDGSIRVQWCHGAPGVVASLAAVAPDDDEHERLLLAGGELTWRAGPLAKGANLCHGTAGNGYAFLALFERTGDELWLERARAFAMHSAAQVARARAGARARPLHAADGRPGNRALPRRLPGRRRIVSAALTPRRRGRAIRAAPPRAGYRRCEP